MSTEDVIEYSHYLARFETHVGPLEVGQYGQYRGRLIPKMGAAAYHEKITTYLESGQRFSDMITAGDTIDDGLAVELRSAEVELVLAESLFLPSFIS